MDQEKIWEWDENKMDDNLIDNWEDNQLDACEESFAQFLSDWERQWRLATVKVVCDVVHMVSIIELYFCSNYVDRSLVTIGGERETVRRELMFQLTTSNIYCRDLLRMGPDAFARLYELLQATGRLTDNKNSMIEEQVAKFYLSWDIILRIVIFLSFFVDLKI